MDLYVTSDHTGDIILQRKLLDDESLDPNDYIKEVEDLYYGETEISREGGYCPLGCCDLTIEIAEYPGTGVCWSAQSYFWRTL